MEEKVVQISAHLGVGHQEAVVSLFRQVPSTSVSPGSQNNCSVSQARLLVALGT